MPDDQIGDDLLPPPPPKKKNKGSEMGLLPPPPKKKLKNSGAWWEIGLEESGRSGGSALGKVGAAIVANRPKTEQQSIREDLSKIKGTKVEPIPGVQIEEEKFDVNDPIKSVNKKIFEKTVRFDQPKSETTNQQALSAENIIEKQKGEQAEMAERVTPHNAAKAIKTVMEESFPTSKEARKWLYQSGKQFDEKNETDVLARDVIHNYENVKSKIEQYGGDLTKAAIDYYSDSDPQLKLLKEKGIAPPENVQGDLLARFLQEKSVKEWGNSSQEAHNIYKEEQDNFWQRHPEQRVNKIMQMIAQGREDQGRNNPFLNLVGVKSSDEVIESLSMRGEIDEWDKKFYYEQVRPLIQVHAKNIPTTGLLENAFQSAAKGIEDLPKGVYELTGLRDLVTTQADRTYQNLEEDAGAIGVTPKNFINKVTHATGNLAGVLVPISGGAKLIQGANLMKDAKAANQLMMGLTFYHDFQKEAEKNNPGDPLGNHLTALIQSAIFMKINSVIPNMSKNIFGESKAAVTDILNKLKTNEITGIQAKEAIVNTVVNKAVQVGGHSVKGASEMALATGLSDVVGGIFSGKFDADKTLQNVAHTFEHMMLGMPLMNIATMRGSQREVAGQTLERISQNPEQYRSEINKQAELDPEFAKQAPQLLQNLDHVVEVKAQIDGIEGLKPKQKQDLLIVELQKKILEDKIKNNPSKILSSKEEKQLAEIEISEKKILDPEMSNTKLVEEFYDEDLLPKGSMMLLEGENGKFSEAKVGEYLKFIAQQSNGLTADWKADKTGKPTMEGIPNDIIEIANERWKKEIESALPKEEKTTKAAVVMPGEKSNTFDVPLKKTEIDQVRELADENTPIEKEAEQSNVPVREVFSSTPELSKIGTEQEYNEYLKTVFPDSQLKDIVYHRSNEKFDQFDESRRNSDTGNLFDFSQTNDKTEYGKNVYPVLLNIKKMGEGFVLDNGTDGAKNEIIGGDKIYSVPNSNQIHILGSKSDVEGFKKWKESKSTQSSPVIEEGKTEQKNETAQESVEGDKPVSSKEESVVREVPTETSEGAKEPPKDTETKVVVDGEGNIGGITHAANEVRRKDRALPEYQREPETFEKWNNEAENAIKEGYDVEGLIDRIEKGHDPTPVENSIRKIYQATLDAEISKNPTDALLAQQKRVIEAGDLANSRAGRNLVSLKGENSPLSSLSDFYVAKMEAAGVGKLTEQQKKETKEAFDKVQKADENANAALEAYREEISRLKAENELLKQKKEPKKKGDFAQQRKDAVEGAREALKKLRTGEAGLTVRIPLVNELVAIAPHVKKYVGSLIGEGAYTLKEVVSKAYNEFKDILEGITEKDIHNIIAGEHNPERPTRNELAAKMRDLRDEAYYINKLERLLAGTEPKSEKKKVIRNRQIEELKQKISDFKKAEAESLKEPKEQVDADLKKLNAIKKRNEKQTEEILDKIKKGDFETKKRIPFLEDPEMQKKFPKEYKAALDAIVKKEEARHEFDIALLRDEMARRNWKEKAGGLLDKTVGTAKAVVTGIDDSAVAIQTYMSLLRRPRTGITALRLHAAHAFSQNKFNRWLAALHNSSDFKFMKDAGLDVTEPQSLKEREKEEIFSNRFSGTIKIKGKEYKLIDAPLKPFERAFTTLGNVTRVVGFRTIAEKYMKEGYTWEKDPELFKSLANRLNTETGRGKQNEYIENASKIITKGIWSPRLMAAKFNILGISDLSSIFLSKAGTKGYYRQLHPKERLAAIRDVAQFAVTVMALSYGLAIAYGGEVDDDPQSSTFLDVKLPNGKSVNLSGGFSGYIRTITQFATGKKRENGKLVEANRLKTFGRFWRGKTPPITAGLLSLANEKDYMGQPTDAKKEAIKAVVPISVRGILEQIKSDGAVSFFTQGIPTFFGFNVKNESDFDKEKDSSRSRSREPRKPAERERAKRE
jgi:hypothetical protein